MHFLKKVNFRCTHEKGKIFVTVPNQPIITTLTQPVASVWDCVIGWLIVAQWVFRFYVI